MLISYGFDFFGSISFLIALISSDLNRCVKCLERHKDSFCVSDTYALVLSVP